MRWNPQEVLHLWRRLKEHRSGMAGVDVRKVLGGDQNLLK